MQDRSVHKAGLTSSLRPTSIGQLLLSLVLALPVVGCSDRSSEEKFAERVCSASLTHARQMLRVADDVVHTRAAPGLESWVALVGFTDRGAEITRAFHAEVLSIPAPTADDGKKANRFVILFGRQAVERMTEEKRRVRQLPRSLTLVESIRALEHLEQTLSDAFALMTVAKGITTTQMPELEDAFKDADSCSKLDAVGTVTR